MTSLTHWGISGKRGRVSPIFNQANSAKVADAVLGCLHVNLVISVGPNLEKGGHSPVGVFSRVLRDSSPRFVGPSVGPSVTLYFFWVFAFFGLTAPAQVIK